MRRTHPFLRLIVILGVIVVVLGLARGWFYFSHPNQPNDKVNVQFTVDTQKVKEDSTKVKDAAAEFGDKVVHKTKELEHKATDREQPTTPPVPLDQPQTPQPQTPPPGNQVPANPPGSVLR